MANLTIKVDDALLRRARVRALQDGTSVNQVLVASLQAFAGVDSRERGWEDFLDGAQEQVDVIPGGRDWSRDDLHAR
jgi:hypothetical protein